jgi:acetyl esterase/lipase
MILKLKWASVFAASLVVMLISTRLAISQEQPKQPAEPGLPEGVKVLRDLQYVEGGHERNRLDLYLPEKAEGRLPLVVWIHGGGWRAGSKENCPAVPLAAKGYAVASINYRFSQHAVFPAQIHDCKAAIRWLRANAAKYHLDPDHIGVWGSSAGGHLVAMLGTTGDVKDLEGTGGNLGQSSRVQCVVDWFGPSNMATMGKQADQPGSPESQLIGGPIPENPEKARRASPLTYVGKNSAQFLIMHGDKDNTVPLNQSEVLADALKKAGVEANLVVVKGNGHGGPGFNSPENRKLIEDFFAKHLRKGRPAAKVLITISKETTYITGPLRKDGYVDYVAALNQRFRAGVTPENNAAVPFLKAVGPGEIAPNCRGEYFKMLGIPPLPENGDYYVTLEKYAQRSMGADRPAAEAGATGRDLYWEQLTQAMKRPWSKKEFPVVAGWLACAGDQGLLQHARLTPRQIARMRADLDKLPPMAKMVDKINVGERFTYLDCVGMVARERLSLPTNLTDGSKPRSMFESLADATAREAVDWDHVLRMGNSWYDRMADACGKPTRAQRQSALGKIDDDVRKLTATIKDRKSLYLSLLGGVRYAVSERIGQFFVSLLLPDASSCARAVDRSAMRFDLTRLAFALAAYHADRSAYPEKLADLVPQYVADVPKDIFSDSDLHYRSEGGGYLLYSVGPNGKDDGGKGRDDCKAGEDWDDIAVRISAAAPQRP